MVSQPETPQSGMPQQSTTANSKHIIYNVDSAQAAQEHLLWNLMLIGDAPITIEALCYALL